MYVQSILEAAQREVVIPTCEYKERLQKAVWLKWTHKASIVLFDMWPGRNLKKCGSGEHRSMEEFSLRGCYRKPEMGSDQSKENRFCKELLQ